MWSKFWDWFTTESFDENRAEIFVPDFPRRERIDELEERVYQLQRQLAHVLQDLMDLKYGKDYGTLEEE